MQHSTQPRREDLAMIEVACPNCHETLSIPEKYIGTRGKCRKCGGAILVEEPKVSTSNQASSNGNSSEQYGDFRNPNIIVLHVETTGPSSRRCNMIELGSVKIDMSGRELDTHWTFCNPDQHIPHKIMERTGISEDMVAQAPYPFEVSREWFNWAGPHPIIVTDHAHFHAKFIAAPFFREDEIPPECRVIDVVEWAKAFKLPTQEYRLRPLLESIGAAVPNDSHRALDTCRSMQKLAELLLEKESAVRTDDGDKSLFGKIMGKGSDAEAEKLYAGLLKRSQTLEKAWGDFYEYRAFDARRRGVPMETLHNETAAEEGGTILHLPEWFEEKKRQIKKYRSQPSHRDTMEVDHSGDAPWEFALIEASQSQTPEEKREYLMKAIDLRATDPKPYEQLLGFFIKTKEYDKAHDVCESYFESESWKQPQFAGTSLKILEKLQKIEHKLAKNH